MSRVAGALERLKAAGAKVRGLTSPCPLTPPTFGPGSCSAEIQELLGDALEALAEYAEYLSLCRRVDAPDVFCGYFLHSPLNVVRSDTSHPQRLHLHDGLPSPVEVSVLPIGSDGGGNLFLLGTTPPSAGAVWKWNHDCPIRMDGVADEGLHLIAESFAAFLERLAADWEHFTQSDRQWSYVAG